MNRNERREKMTAYLVEKMTHYLETMCADHATGNTAMFHYSAGRADAIRAVLEDAYGWDERYADEHIKAMWDIMDENW